MFDYHDIISKLLNTKLGIVLACVLLILILGFAFYLIRSIFSGLKISVKFWPITLAVFLNVLSYIKPPFKNIPLIYFSLAISLLLLWLSVALYKLNISNKSAVFMAVGVEVITLYGYYLMDQPYFILALVVIAINILLAIHILISTSHFYKTVTAMATHLGKKTKESNRANVGCSLE